MKDFLIAFAIVAGIFGFTIFLAGLPGEEVTFYENDTVVCKKWSTEWQLGRYPNRECWNLEEVK